MKNILKILFIMILSWNFLTACSTAAENPKAKTNPTSPTETKKADSKIIGLSIAGSDVCYDAAADVFEENAKKEGWKVIRNYSDYTAEKEIMNINEFIAKKVDAVAIISTDIVAGGTAAKNCNNANIPVFFLFFTPDLSNGAVATSIITTDWYMTGFANGEYISKKYPDAKCALVEGGYNQGMAEMMRDGFRDGLKSVKDSRAKVVAYHTGSWMKPNAMLATEELLKKGLEFDVIFAGNEEMLKGVIETLKEKNILEKYKLFSENGREDVGIKYIKEGIVEATAGAPTTADAEIGFQIIKAYFDGKEIPKHVNNPVKLLTKDNIGEAVPWITKDFIEYKNTHKGVFDYTRLEVVTKEREWSKVENSKDESLFYK